MALRVRRITRWAVCTGLLIPRAVSVTCPGKGVMSWPGWGTAGCRCGRLPGGWGAARRRSAGSWPAAPAVGSGPASPSGRTRGPARKRPSGPKPQPRPPAVPPLARPPSPRPPLPPARAAGQPMNVDLVQSGVMLLHIHDWTIGTRRSRTIGTRRSRPRGGWTCSAQVRRPCTSATPETRSARAATSARAAGCAESWPPACGPARGSQARSAITTATAKPS
jgi:hypothetical protein